MQNRTPWGERGGTLAKTQLAEVREAHWRALATTITLEEKIEQLSQSLTRDYPDAHAPSQSWDQWRRRSWGQSRRHYKALPESSHADSPAHSPPWWEDEEAGFNLGPPLELGPDVKCFLHGPAGECEEDTGSHFPAEPPAEEYEMWVEWRGWVVDIPSWWQELEMIPDVDDIQELAQKIRASFELPQWMSEVHSIDNYYLAPLAPHCLCWKDFLFLPDLRFPSWDLWEEQWKKTMAYAQALKCWAKRANLPTPGQPCLLVGSVLELCKTMEQYVSFSNDIILDSVALPEGLFRSQTSIPRDTQPTSTDVPSEEVAKEEVAPIGGPLEESTLPQVLLEKWVKMEALPNWFPAWEKVLHPSQLVTAMGQAPPAFGESKQRHHHWSSEAMKAWCQRAEEQLQVELAEWNSPESLEPMHMVAPCWCFEEVMACLWEDTSPVIALEVPLEFMQPEVVIKPMVAMMCDSCVVQDEASEVTYMEIITTSMGQVALECTCPAVQNPQLTIKEITNLPKEERDDNHF